MNEAKFLIKTNLHHVINEACMVSVDGVAHKIFMRVVAHMIHYSVPSRRPRDEEGSEFSSSPVDDSSFGEEGEQEDGFSRSPILDQRR